MMRRFMTAAGGAAVLVLLSLANLRCGDFGDSPVDDGGGAGPDAADAPPSDGDPGDAGPAADPFAVAEHYKDGSRLKASAYVTSDGARQFRGWYDTMLGAVCDFVRHEDGKLRCVPRGANDSLLYSEAGCADASRVVYRGACDAVPKFARAQNAVGECEPTYRVFSVGGAVSAAAYYLRASDAATCPGSPTPLEPGAQLFARGAEVPGTDLVEGTEIEWTPAGSVAPPPVLVRFIRGSDGSEGFFRVAEKYRGETCELRSASSADPGIRCVPSRTLLHFDFTDPGCQDDAFLSFSGQACPRPAFGKIFKQGADICQSIEEFAVLAMQPTLSIYRKTELSCEPVPLDGGTNGGGVYVAGTPYGLMNFASATAAPLRSDRRLDRLQYVLADGTKLPRGFADFGRWHDTQRKEECELRVAADGKARCIPPTQASVSVTAKYFSDVGCMSPIPTPIAQGTGCERPVKYVSVPTDPGSGCGTVRIHAVGAEVTSLVYRIARAGQACTASPPDVNNPKYYAGAEIPPADFAEVTPTTP